MLCKNYNNKIYDIDISIFLKIKLMFCYNKINAYKIV